jgi:hypothetical protein
MLQGKDTYQEKPDKHLQLESMRLRQQRKEEILRKANSTAPNRKKLKEKPEEHPCSLKKIATSV